MAPWDELKYFDLPKESTFTSAQPLTSPAILANPNRIAIIFSAAVGTGQINVTTNGPAANNKGGQVSNTLTLAFTHRDFPGLPQQAWFASVQGTGVLNVTEIVMAEYPPNGLESDKT